MAFDIYWQQGRKRLPICKLEVDKSLHGLLTQFERRTGIRVAPYGKSRLDVDQWKQLVDLAQDMGYQHWMLHAVQRRLAERSPEGVLLLEGD